jgi:nucleoside-diphosphate-sugar epimerase
VDGRYVAQAFILELENTNIHYDAFNITSGVPFSVKEFSRCLKEHMVLVEDRFSRIYRTDGAVW